MRHTLKAGILCALITLYFSRSFGQVAESDTAYLNSAKDLTIQNFNTSVSEQSRLYSGREYFPYDLTIKGNAFYPSTTTTWVNGEVNYDGIVYKNVPLMYDTYKDEVISLLYNKFSKYALLSERVHDFTFLNHHFVRVVVDSLKKDKSGVSTGFYDQLYHGKCEVLAKRMKEIQTNSSSFGVETNFVEKHEYYVKCKGVYYKVSSQGSVLAVFKDKKPDLKQYLRQNNIKYKNDPELAMARLAAYYDSITN